MALKSGVIGCEVRLLSALNADPDAEGVQRKTVVPYLAWSERITLLAAREKDGKSTLAAAAAAAVSSGGEFLGERVTQRPVLWVGLEEHSSDVRVRFNDFEADDKWVFTVEALGSPMDDLESAVARIAALDFPAPLVVVDTLAALTSGIIAEAGSSAQWSPVMSRLVGLARWYDGASVLLLHHTRKSDNQYRDSSAIGANVDMIFEMSAPSGTERKLSPKGRWRVEEYTVSLIDGRFRLVAGGKPIEEYVLDVVRVNSGCSKNAVRNAP